LIKETVAAHRVSPRGHTHATIAEAFWQFGQYDGRNTFYGFAGVPDTAGEEVALGAVSCAFLASKIFSRIAASLAKGELG
jgi:hypothetical protein